MPVTYESCMAEADVWAGLNFYGNGSYEDYKQIEKAKQTICQKIMSFTNPEELEAYAANPDGGLASAPKAAAIARRRAQELRLAATKPTLEISTNSRNPADQLVSRGSTTTDAIWNRLGGEALQAQGTAEGSVAKSTSWITYAWIAGAVFAVAGGGYLAYRYANQGRRHNPAPRGGDMVWTEDGEVFMPDQRILKDKSEFVYRPLRGYSNLLAVFDINDRCIGWISTQTLGYPDVKSWMAATKYIVRGKKRNPVGMLVTFEDEIRGVRVSNSDTSFIVPWGVFERGMERAGLAAWIGQPEVRLDWQEWEQLLAAFAFKQSRSPNLTAAKTRRRAKINQRDYKYYVVSARRDTGRVVITSGNEYREDAKDAMLDLPPAAQDEDRRVYTKSALVRMGIDPDVNANWGNP